MNDEQRLDEIRGFLKNMNVWDEGCTAFFEPAVITEHPDYTVVVAPSSAEPEIDPPDVYCIENSELLKLSKYVDAYENGDGGFEKFKIPGTSLVDTDPTRENMFWDLFFALSTNHRRDTLDLRFQTLGDYVGQE